MVQCRRLDQVLQMRPAQPKPLSLLVLPSGNVSPGHSPGQKVSQIDKLAMPLVLDVDDTPPSLSAPDGLAIHHDRAFRPDDGKGDHRL
jgi:hypothetical protein